MAGVGKIWLFSDPHFNHTSIIKSERKEFSTIEEHNNTILKNINSLVSPADMLICLGDLGFHWQKYVDKMNGAKKILVIGNHDTYRKDIYYAHFDMVYDSPIFLNKKIILSHEPWPGCGEYCINIHGHLHNSYLKKKGYFNVNVANTNYKPVEISDFSKYLSECKKNEEPFLFEWYADDYFYKEERYKDCPIMNHRLISGFRNIPEIINKFNMKHKTTFSVKDINWLNYNEGDDLKEFINKELEKGEH